MLRRRKPLRRGAPPKRFARLPKRRARPRRSLRVVDERYLQWCREQTCAVGRWLASVGSVWTWPCSGRVDPHHAGLHVHGMGAKPDDDTCMPACRGHHDNLEDAAGPFKDWPPERLRGWQDRIAGEERARYLEERGMEAASA